ncbi:MAG: hypothetical protein LBG29_09925 [Synergistaceae bacterium]|jgi:hypothetical protein|nr:hypothetical protein [Synergistaceae bacterium]
MPVNAFSAGGFKPNGVQKWLLVLAAAALVFIAAAAVRFGGTRQRNLLASLPRPDENAPLLMISASRGEFPEDIFRLFADSATIAPAGVSPISLIAPLLSGASDSAVVVTEREWGLSAYGAFALAGDEMTSLSSGILPPGWERHFIRPEVKSDDDGLLMISSLGVSGPLYVEVSKNAAYVADTKSDILRIRNAGLRAGRASGEGGVERIDYTWRVEKSWSAHMLISDGGVIGAIAGGDSSRADQISLETAWRSSGAAKEEGSHAIEAKWQIQGLENYIDKGFMAGLKKYDWRGRDFFIPAPLIASCGINLPSLGKAVKNGKNGSGFLAALDAVINYLDKMGLKQSESIAMMSGPTVLSLGGRTQILWFELPGFTVDMSGRGKMAHRLVERFWAETFMGTSPKPVPGYASGGATDLPFSVMAAANDEKAVLGLTAPDVEMDQGVKRLLEHQDASVGWLYVDLPRLGASLSEMSSVNAFIYEEDGDEWGSGEEKTSETKQTEAFRESLAHLGTVFVLLDSANEGRAYWY